MPVPEGPSSDGRLPTVSAIEVSWPLTSCNAVPTWVDCEPVPEAGTYAGSLPSCGSVTEPPLTIGRLRL